MQWATKTRIAGHLRKQFLVVFCFKILKQIIQTVKDKIALGGVALVVVFAANFVSEGTASVVFGLGFAYVIASVPVAIIGAGITVLLTGAFGLCRSAVVTKPLRHLEPAP